MARLAQAAGVLIILMGIVLVVVPEPVISFFSDGPPSLQYFAGILRLGLGLVFIKAAAGSRYPVFLKVIGILTVIGGIVLLVLPSDLWASMMAWISQGHVLRYRFIGAVLAMVLGAFVVRGARPAEAAREQG